MDTMAQSSKADRDKLVKAGMKDVVLPEAELKILAEKGAGVKDLVRKQVGDETMNAFLDSLK